MFRFCAFAALLLLTSCGQTGKTAEHRGRIIALTDSIVSTGGSDTVRFGRLHSGEIAQLQLWLDNQTAHPIIIASYERSCGCTTLEFKAEPILPGNAQQVTLRFDSRGEQGWQLKTLDIHPLGAQGALRLFIEAEVK